MTSVLQRLCSGEAPVSLGRALDLACGACWQASCLPAAGPPGPLDSAVLPHREWTPHSLLPWRPLAWPLGQSDLPKGQGGALQKLSPPFRSLKITATWVVSLSSSVS